MAEIADLLCCKRALLGSEFELGVAESLEDLSEAGKVLFPRGGKDDDVVQVKEAGSPVSPAKTRSMSREKVAGALQRPNGT